jgi:prefoldin subunit 5
MELDSKVEKEKLVKEIQDLQGQASKLQQQLSQLQTAIIQRQGAIGFLNEKDKEMPTKKMPDK